MMENSGNLLIHRYLKSKLRLHICLHILRPFLIPFEVLDITSNHQHAHFTSQNTQFWIFEKGIPRNFHFSDRSQGIGLIERL